MILGGKYDLFQNFDPEKKKIVCRALRFFSHHHGAALQFYRFLILFCLTGFLSEIRTKLRDWTVWQARALCDSQSAFFSNDSKTL